MSETPSDFANSSIMNYALRMVIPVRREFGRSLDVQHLLHDRAYAKEVIDEAKTSQNPKLREYAELLDSKLFGPRNASAPSAAVLKRAAEAPDSPSASASGDKIQALEEKSKKAVMDKYKSGLR